MLTRRNAFTWSQMIAAYAQNGDFSEALLWFKRMDLEGVKPDRITFIRAIGACCNSRDIAEGRRIHSRAAEAVAAASDIFVSAAILNMYGKCGYLDEARRVFDGMPHKDGFSWTALLRAYLQQGRYEQALEIYMESLLAGMRPNEVTFLSILSACSGLEALRSGKSIHSQIVESGFASNAYIASRLIRLYASCNRLDEAIRVLETIVLFHSSDVVPWNAMIAAYAGLGRNREAIQLYHRMNLEGLESGLFTFISAIDACAGLGDLKQGRAIHACAVETGEETDEVLMGCLIKMYGKCGDLREARRLLDRTGLRNLVSCTGMITAYFQNDRFRDALELFFAVEQAGTKVNSVTLLNVMVAFQGPKFLARGREIHCRLAQIGQESDVTVTNALISMYSRCGSFTDAKWVFDRASKKNLVTWNSIIGACVLQRECRSALQLFRSMEIEGESPNSITMANVVEACIQLGALDQGRAIHAEIRGSELEADENVKSLLINMYTKCGSLADAERALVGCSGVVPWTTMIAAYAQHSRFEDCIKQWRRMEMEGIRMNEVTFLTVLFACSHAGLVEEGCRCFVKMSREHSIAPSLEQYSCVVDLIARAGWLREAEDFIRRMPLPPNRTTWLSLLNACKMHSDVERAVRVAEKVIELDPENTSARAMLQDVCAGAGIRNLC